MRGRLAVAALLSGMLVAGTAWSTTVFVVSVTNGRADLLVNGTVRSLRAGQTSPEGVTLNSASAAGAELVVDGKPLFLGLGQSVLEGGRAQLDHVLIGMSFLRNVEMRRSGDTLLLQKANY
jgi:hypothetical protein